MERAEEPTIRLDQFLKWRGLADSGGQAKVRVQAGEVTVNGAVETRRGRKLRAGDRVGIDGAEHTVDALGE
jgi:ribosome-associated protein